MQGSTRLLVLLFAAAAPLAAQAPHTLTDGQLIEVHGTLAMQPVGRLQFATVATTEAYVPVFTDVNGHRVKGETLHGIGLDAQPLYDTLYQHRNQAVTVRGRLEVDAVSPYFWHMTRLHVDSMKLQDGKELMHAPPPPVPGPSATVRQYTAVATLAKDLTVPWTYRVTAPALRGPAAQPYLRCSSSGGGDVVNCLCAEGFHARSAVATLNGERHTGILLDFAQFPVLKTGNDAAIPITLTVGCSR